MAATHLSVAVVTSKGIDIVEASIEDSPYPQARLFDLASLTKLFTATRTLHAITIECLDIEEVASRSLPPQLQQLGDQTFRELLEYRGGYSSTTKLHQRPPFAANHLAGEEYGRDFVLSSFGEVATSLRSSERDARVYNDVGYLLLGEVLYKDGDWSKAQNWIRDVGLTETCYQPLASDWQTPQIVPTEFDPWRATRCHGVVHDELAYLLGGVAGHAGIFSTCVDMARFAQMWLFCESGNLAVDESFIEAALNQKLCVFRTESELGSSERILPVDAVGLTGFTGTSIWMSQSRRIAVVILSNRVYGGRSSEWITFVRREIHSAAFR